MTGRKRKVLVLFAILYAVTLFSVEVFHFHKSALYSSVFGVTGGALWWGIESYYRIYKPKK
jgi:hypothetical protein